MKARQSQPLDYIGLEMGTVYSTLGARLDVAEMLGGLMQGADRDLVKIWQKMNAKRFDNIMLKTKTVGARALPEGIEVTFAPMEEGEAGGNASVAAPAPQVYDLVLQAVGRTPNGKKIAADKAGVAVTDRGFINVDIQMRTNVPHRFREPEPRPSIAGCGSWRTRHAPAPRPRPRVWRRARSASANRQRCAGSSASGWRAGTGSWSCPMPTGFYGA